MNHKKAILISVLILTVVLTVACTSEVDNKAITIEYNGVPYDGSYTGVLADGFPNGIGKFVYGDPDTKDYLIYDGNWDTGKFAGEGFLSTSYYDTYAYFDDSSEKTEFYGEYEGPTLDGLANGEGEISVEDNNGEVLFTYSGDWKNGAWNGYGVLDFTDENFYDEIGTFDNGAYWPNAADLIASLGTKNQDCPYSLSDAAYDFIDSNESVFLEHDKAAIDKLKPGDFNIGVFKKNPSAYEPRLVDLKWLHIQQAMEETFGGYTITFILAYDHDWNYYWLRCIGTSDAFVENKEIRAIIMPLGYSTYETVSGSSQWAVSGVIAY